MVPVIFMNADCTLLHGICTIKATFLHLRQIFCSCEHAVAKNGKFNPFPDDPEEGVRRMIQQQPSCKASTSWIKIPYVKDSNYEGWPCSKGTNKVVTIPPGAFACDRPVEDRPLPDWKGSVCPHCQLGKLSARTTNRDAILRYRCNRKGCQRYFLLQPVHPIFTATNGHEAALPLRLLNVPTSSILILTHISHKAHKTLEKMSRNLMITRKGYVQQEEQNIKFGGCPRARK